MRWFNAGPESNVDALRRLFSLRAMPPHQYQVEDQLPDEALIESSSPETSPEEELKVGEVFDNDGSMISGADIVAVMVAVALLGCLVVGVVMCRRRRRKGGEGDSLGPSIVVYPSYQGKGPELMCCRSSDIGFKLPPLRHATSLDAVDLMDDVEGNGEQVTDHHKLSVSLSEHGSDVSVAPSHHSHRSNSFSGFSLGAIDPSLYRGRPGESEDDLLFPDDHLGRIWFTARFEPTAEKLQVCLVKAKNLPSRTVGTVNSCDPYVRLHLLPDERRYQQSRQHKKTCNPHFDENFVFQVSSKDFEEHSLQLTVVDGGRDKRRALLGHVTLLLKNLATEVAPGETMVYKMDLEKESKGAVSDLGDLLVSLLYNENLNRLTVTIIQARRVKFRDDRREAYVRVSLLQQYHPLKTKRTSTVRSPASESSPVFSECFNFRVRATSMDITSLSLQLYQPVSGYGRDKLIGKCVLGSFMFARGKALAHWNAAFSSPMETIQQWHALCE